jgi:hypothetical protein
VQLHGHNTHDFTWCICIGEGKEGGGEFKVIEWEQCRVDRYKGRASHQRKKKKKGL